MLAGSNTPGLSLTFPAQKARKGVGLSTLKGKVDESSELARLFLKFVASQERGGVWSVDEEAALAALLLPGKKGENTTPLSWRQPKRQRLS